MNISESTEIQIDRYLFNQMAGEERSNFEKEIKTNSQLSAQVEQIRLEHRAMELMLNEDLSANMNQWKNEAESGAETTQSEGAKVVSMGRRRPLYYRLAAAASVLLVLGLGTRFWAGNNYNDQALAGKYFPSASSAARSIGNADANELTTSLELMKKGNHSAALSELRALPNSASDTQILELIGESEFYLGNYDAAIDVFEKVVRDASSSLAKKSAEMKLLNAYLAAGRKSDFEKLKGEILASGEPKRVEAVNDLENDLGSFWRVFSGN